MLALLFLTHGVLGAEVPRVRLNNGVEMPIIALGTGGFDNATAESAVDRAFELGLRHVHTAFDYFNLPGVGRGLARAADRKSIFVTAMTTPCVHPAAPPIRNVTDPDACYELTLRELNESLALLGQQYVDLVLLHGPSEPFGYEGACGASVCALNQAQWRAYQDFLSAGSARAIGVSNYCQSCLDCILSDPTTRVTPAVNQIQLHVGTGSDPEGLVSYCDSKGIVVQAYSPLAAGGVVTDPLCKSVASAYPNKSSAQIGLRWVLQNSRRPTLVVKASDPKYLAEDLDVLSWNLTAEDVARLDAATVPKGQQDGRPSWGCAH